MNEILDLRRAAAQARLNRDEAIYALKRAEAQALIDWVTVSGHAATPESREANWKLLGPNEEARKAHTLLILDEARICRMARGLLRDAEFALTMAEAEIESWIDVRRKEREAITARLAEALALGGLVEDAATVLR